MSRRKENGSLHSLGKLTEKGKQNFKQGWTKDRVQVKAGSEDGWKDDRIHDIRPV